MFVHRYRRDGAPVLVLLHGIPGSSAAWSKVVDLLTPRFDVVVPDLLGFGRSPRPADLSAEAQAEALEAALRDAGIARATLVGHDFGGPIALTLYRRNPQLFDAIALMATNAFPDTPIPFPLSAVTLPVVGSGLARLLFSKPALKMMLASFGGRELGDARSVRLIFADALRNLQQRYGGYPDLLSQISVPSVAIWGDRDPFFPIEQAHRLASLLGHETVIIPGAGHFLPEQRPAEVADALIDLVARAHPGLVA